MTTKYIGEDIINKTRKYKTKTYNLEEGLLKTKVSIVWLLNLHSRTNIIQIVGGSASGKTNMVTRALQERFKERLTTISMDDYYYGKTHMQELASRGKNLSWDDPEAINIPLLQEHLEELKNGKQIKKPIYSMKTSEPSSEEIINPSEIILLEGLFSLTEGLHEKGDLNIFVHANPETRLKRRIERDILRTGQTEKEIKTYFSETVEPMHQKYIQSTAKNAHIIIENN